MWVQCILCERYIEIDDETTVAKHFRKRPDYAYLCSRCGGALGDLEKTVLPPGQRPEEIAASERVAPPTFASWSEPKTARQRPPRGEMRGETPGASPRGVVELPRLQARPRDAQDRGTRPEKENLRNEAAGGRPRQNNGQPTVGGQPGAGGQAGAGGHPGSAGHAPSGRSRRHRGRHGAPSAPSAKGAGPGPRPPRPEP